MADPRLFFSESSYNVFPSKLPVVQALQMIRDRLSLDNSMMAFPLLDDPKLLSIFHKYHIFTLEDFVVHNTESVDSPIRYLICCSCFFCFNQNRNYPFPSQSIGRGGEKGKSSAEVKQMKLESVNVLFFELTQLVLVRPVIDSLRLAQQYRSPTVHAVRPINLADSSICSFGDSKLDRLLNGGLRTRCLTELWGESGSGKTQLCMSLLTNTVSPPSIGGMGCRAIYLHTDVFPVDRLSQMCDAKFERIQAEKELQKDSHRHSLGRSSMCLNRRYSSMSEEVKQEEISEDVVNADLNIIEGPSDLVDRIFARHVATIPDFTTIIDTHLPQICSMCKESTPIKLVIIDSIASLFRTMKDRNERSVILARLMNELRRTSEQFDLSILIVNQVSDVIPPQSSPFFPKDKNYWVAHSQMAYEAVLYSQINPAKENKVYDETLVNELYPEVPDDLDDEQDEMLQQYQQQFHSRVVTPTKKKPALGLAWSNCVNTSLRCSRSEQPMYSTSYSWLSSLNKRRKQSGQPIMPDACPSTYRQLHVVFAPHLKNGTQSFVIEQLGVRGIDTSHSSVSRQL